MIEVLNPGLQSIIVDKGRFGFGDIGVPTSSCLDYFAYSAVNYLTDNLKNPPVIEVIGPMFSLKFHCNVVFAITGAWIEGTLNDKPITSWKSIKAEKDSILKIKKINEGFRYYIGFSGTMDIEKVMESYTTNIECHFGGLEGRPLKKGDVISLLDPVDTGEKYVDRDLIPRMNPPFILRAVDGPEVEFFEVEKFFKNYYKVSTSSNRTGIRLTGEAIAFKEGMEKSIISEGILPGTVQVPGDGMPVIMLNERTTGGYARIAVVVKADQDMLAHLKPGDEVIFNRISFDEAENLWLEKQKIIKKFLNM